MWWILVIIIIAVVVMGSENEGKYKEDKYKEDEVSYDDKKLKVINIKKMNRNNGKNKLHHMHVSNMPKLHMCHIALMERNLHWFIK